MGRRKNQQEKEADALIQKEIKPLRIMGATMSAGACPYSYEEMKGVREGDESSVKCKKHFTDDMTNAFKEFNVHLAVIDDVFKHSETKFDNISQLINDPLTGLYEVHGFKIKGSREDESIILMGSKYVGVGSWMSLETPKIPIDNLPSYPWHNELKTAADRVRKEVELYRQGKYVIEEPEVKNPKQLTITSVISETEMKDAEI